MKIINGLLLSMFIIASCSKKEAALEPSNKDENYLVVHDNPGDPIGHAVYEIYKATGIPVFYNDTIARRQVGNNGGNPQYFYITLMTNYSPSAGQSNSISYTLLPKERRAISMLGLLKNELLAVLPPLPSIFLTDSLFMPTSGIPIIRNTHVGFNTVSIRSVDPDTMSTDAKKEYVLSVLIRVATQKLESLRAAALANEFYSVSEALSPYLDPYHVLLDQLSFGGPQTFADFGFIISVYFQNKEYSPEKSRDLESYLRAAFSNTTNDFNTTYAAYPAVLKKFDAIRKILTDLQFKLPQ
jgi:hypothetical protein